MTKYEFLKSLKPHKLFHIAASNDCIELHILEGNFFDFLLKFRLVKHLNCVSVNKKHSLAFDLSMARLHVAVCFVVFVFLIPVNVSFFKMLDFTFPFIRNDFKKVVR